MTAFRSTSFFSLCLALAAAPYQSATSPSISVSGGITTGGALQPLVFTWSGAMPVQGSGWAAGDSVALSLEGPLNTPNIASTSIALGSIRADGSGTFSTSVTIPYDRGVVGPQANIPRPGLYSVRATGTSNSVTSAYPINLCPATYTAAGGTIDWSYERGTRAGVLPGILAQYSPERSDPNWISVWDNRPVEIYGTVAGVGSPGANQPARVSFEDDPLKHYAHDTNFYFLPDPNYRWTVGTANYYSNGEDDSGLALGRIEIEWEALNNGSPDGYGQGQIGLPDWAIATTGDRIYVVGRWVLDAGHPELGDRSELHPPRLVAVMRQNPAVTSTTAAAMQVDVYVSGHGGGANLYPSGMDALLDQGGRGGGRLRDVLSAPDQQIYYQPGPLPLIEVPLINLLVYGLSGGSVTGPIFAVAGPTAFSWGTPAPESQPVNDMDYDFDVPLPAAAAGAGPVSVEVTTHAQHTTTVTEQVTYRNPGGGLPPVAHIHLPYHGADNGIYARTLKFSWGASAPKHHFRVTLDHLTVNSLPGKWHMWSDVGGNWNYLPATAPALLQTRQGQAVALPNAQYDLYLRDTDRLRVLVQGYRAQCVDGLFGTLFGMPSYNAGIQLLQTCGPVNNDNLGGALLELPALPSSQGTYQVTADAEDQKGGGAFQATVRVEYLSTIRAPAECQGRGSLAPVISIGGVVGAGLGNPPVSNLSPDGLITVFGQNFAPPGTSRGLNAGDLQNGELPENLACTCVEVNHRLAPMLFVAPGQIDVQAPAELRTGVEAVQVIANCGVGTEVGSTVQSRNAQMMAPEFFFFKQNSNGANPVAAEDATSGALVGAAGLLPGAAFTPAKPGQLVALYATGFGVTDPPFDTGVLATRAAPTVFPVSISLNGVALSASDVLYAGAAPGFAGLYQINIRIPASTPDGDLPVSATIAGVTTSPGAYLTVHK